MPRSMRQQVVSLLHLLKVSFISFFLFVSDLRRKPSLDGSYLFEPMPNSCCCLRQVLLRSISLSLWWGYYIVISVIEYDICWASTLLFIRHYYRHHTIPHTYILSINISVSHCNALICVAKPHAIAISYGDEACIAITLIVNEIYYNIYTVAIKAAYHHLTPLLVNSFIVVYICSHG